MQTKSIFKNILCEKNFQGAYVVSAIFEGRRIHRVYIGYTKSESIRDFKNNPPA